MERSRAMAALAADSAGLLDAARTAAPGAAVPGCPDWTIEDLVQHVAGVHGFWTHIVREPGARPDGYVEPAPPDGRNALFELAADRAADLRRVLDGAGDDRAVWTWSDDHTVGWVRRRMVHETAVHRFDAERAAGRTFRLDPDVAADGIDEFLADLLGRRLAETGGLSATVHLHCTDADGEWTIVPAADGGVTVSREHAKGDLALRGDAHDLLMVLWRRTGLDAVTVFGDGALAASLVGPPTTG